jgi:hypothetical protein
MNDMKLIMESWRGFLMESDNKAFLEEFSEIYEKWLGIQDQYGPIHTGTWIDPDGEAHPPERVQEVPEDEQPDYVKDNPRYYKDHADHPATRRATFSQTASEVELEKELLRLFQKYADQGYFKNDVLKYHDLSYSAAVHQPWSTDQLNFKPFSLFQYLDMETQRGKDVMSCHGSTNGKVNGSYGMILQGHTIFASRNDLGSQTLRTAHDKIRAKHKSSGLPKRPSPHKVHFTGDRLDREYNSYNRRRKISARRGKEPKPEMSKEAFSGYINAVVLNRNDVRLDTSSAIEELLLGNWTVEGWYLSEPRGGAKPHPEAFWRSAHEKGITKPVFAKDMQGNMTRIDLAMYFEDEEE